MSGFCNRCSAKMAAETGLCPSCSVELGQVRDTPAPVSGFAAPANAGVVFPQRRPPAEIAKYVGIAFAGALVLGLVTWLMLAIPGGSESDGAADAPEESDAVSYTDDYLSDSEETLYVTGTANARNLPTTEETEVLRTYAAGDRIEGRWVRGKDHATRWLRASLGGSVGYVWEGNLEARVPPTRAWLLGTWVFASSCETDNYITYNADGTFNALGTSGTYTLEGDVLREVWMVTHPQPGDDPSAVDRPIRPPSTHSFTIERTGENSTTMEGSSGEKNSLIRC